MRVQDIIRSMIDMVDHMQSNNPITTPKVIVAHPTATVVQPGDASPLTHAGDDINRFRQIVDLADKDISPIGNSPDEHYADLDSVTVHAGGGLNGPKHPADIRVKDPSATPHLIDAPAADEETPHLVMIKTLNRGM